MAMRARGGGVNPNRPRRAIVGRVYEPFKPVSEWAQQDDYDILLVYLPGFQKEFIKVTTEDRNILRVRGERLVSGNKWSRFQEDFQVPQNCKMTGIRAKFDSGILTITMPRNIIDPPIITTTTTTAATPKADKPIKSSKQDKDSESTLPSSAKQEKDSANASSSSAIKNGDKATKKDALNHALEALEKPTKPQTTSDATLLPQPPFANRFEEKEKPTRPNQTTLDATLLPQPPFLNRFEAKEKPTRPNQTTLDSTLLPQPPFANRFEAKEKPTRPNQTTFDATLLPQPPMANPNGSKPLLPSLGKPNDQGKTNEIKPLDRANKKEPITEKIAQITKRDSELKNKEVNKLEEYKTLVKGVAMGGMKEERELLVNMGVAVLVIVALGAYVSYTIGSSSKGN